MTLTIELTQEEESKLRRAAESKGISLETAVHELIREQPDPAANAPAEDPAEWIRRFDAWLEMNKHRKVVLSEYAMSRESIYGDDDESGCS